MRIFLDANILFTAAHRPEGKSASVIQVAQENDWVLCTSRYALEEARRNLERKYPQCLQTHLHQILNLEVIPEFPCSEGLVNLPSKDLPIFFAALGGEAQILLTGDVKDFGALMNDKKKAKGLLIQTVNDFLDEIERSKVKR
jgi:predicted nucleic acid-binding protein